MGIIESFPEIKGKSITINSKNEKEYFNRTNIILRKNYITNKYSKNNILKSLELKTFNEMNDPGDIKYYTWIEYLVLYINILKEKYHSPWAFELLNILKENNFDIPDNKYFSDFFYNEYQIDTMPRIINSQNENLDNNPFDNYGDLFNLFDPLFHSELPIITDKNYCELDVLENLGGSFQEINIDEIEDDNKKYYLGRINVKKYIKIFKEHIYNNSDHPINKIISIFNKLFSKYIEDKIKEYHDQLEKMIITQERFDNSIQNLEKEITYSLQEFICRMHSAVKLFYSSTIDLKVFRFEKDDLINLITTFFFRTGKLYESVLNLYSIIHKEELQILQNKLIELKPLRPKQLGLDIKFCLDQDTIDLQNTLKKNKKIKLNREETNENNNEVKKPKKTSLFQNLAKENKINDLYPIKEREEENIKIIEGSNNFKDNGELIFNIVDEEPNKDEDKNKIVHTDYNIPTRSKTKLSRLGNDDNYLLERLSFLENSINDTYYNPANYIRNSINNFNNKTYFFPKLNKQLKNSINLNENGSKLPLPYISAINLMKSLTKYKTPFEKIILLAAINDQIMESVTSFWKDMTPYIETQYLCIEGDELQNIFIYIIIQSQMPELFLYCKLIKNFMTQQTQTFSIFYNCILLETCLDYIIDIKDINELCEKQNGFIEASKSILNISNQRISRLSLGMNQG